jgi:hypothetical protein
MEKIFILLVIFQLKHFVADYPLQNAFMLGKFKDGWAFALPLAAHAGVHALFTFCIAFSVTNRSLLSALLALADFVIHFMMDRIKAGKKYLGRFKPLTAEKFPTASKEEKRQNEFFWWSLGFDQMIHHLTHYAIMAAIIFL